MKRLIITERITNKLKKQYPDWHIYVMNARRVRGKKRVYRYDLTMHPKHGWVGGTDDGRLITL